MFVSIKTIYNSLHLNQMQRKLRRRNLFKKNVHVLYRVRLHIYATAE